MFQAIYERQRQRGKHHLVALSHVANKLMRVVYAVLKEQRTEKDQTGQEIFVHVLERRA